MNKKQRRAAEKSAATVTAVTESDHPADVYPPESVNVNVSDVFPVDVATYGTKTDPAFGSAWMTDRQPSGRANVGTFTGRSIMDFQNWLYRENATMRLTDYQLAILWAVEFPAAKCDFMAHPDYIGSTRTLYNRGKHAQTSIPAVASVPYANGEPARFAVCRPARIDRARAVTSNRRDPANV